jgi:hypothetical protein
VVAGVVSLAAQGFARAAAAFDQGNSQRVCPACGGPLTSRPGVHVWRGLQALEACACPAGHVSWAPASQPHAKPAAVLKLELLHFAGV